MVSMEDRQLTVLVCDDSILVRKQLKDLLEDLGCQVLEAKNGLQGVELYRQEKPDAVFLDIVMPEMDGIQALQAIRESDSQAKVVMVSSAATASHVKQALRLGAFSFIQKPYTKEEISQVILSIRK
jgi:two-component system chemotaxis response regulator CheY